MSSRASFVSSTASRRTPPGSGTARCRNVSSCSSLSPSRFSSAESSSHDIGFSAPSKSGSSGGMPGAVST